MASLKFVTIKWLIFLGTKLSSFYIGKGWGYKSMKAITSFDSDLRKMSWPLLQRTIASVASYQTPKAKGARTHRSVVSILGFKVHQLSEEKRVHKMNIFLFWKLVRFGTLTDQVTTYSKTLISVFTSFSKRLDRFSNDKWQPISSSFSVKSQKGSILKIKHWFHEFFTNNCKS